MLYVADFLKTLKRNKIIQYFPSLNISSIIVMFQVINFKNNLYFLYLHEEILK